MRNIGNKIKLHKQAFASKSPKQQKREQKLPFLLVRVKGLEPSPRNPD
jgi:hypothetical protein